MIEYTAGYMGATETLLAGSLDVNFYLKKYFENEKSN